MLPFEHFHCSTQERHSRCDKPYHTQNSLHKRRENVSCLTPPHVLLTACYVWLSPPWDHFQLATFFTTLPCPSPLFSAREVVRGCSVGSTASKDIGWTDDEWHNQFEHLGFHLQTVSPSSLGKKKKGWARYLGFSLKLPVMRKRAGLCLSPLRANRFVFCWLQTPTLLSQTSPPAHATGERGSIG